MWEGVVPRLMVEHAKAIEPDRRWRGSTATPDAIDRNISMILLPSFLLVYRIKNFSNKFTGR